MSAHTLTLTDFLLARIAEDEAVASSLGHVPQWGSKRALAECEAKRRIIEDHRLIALPEHHRKLITPDKVPDRCGRCWASPGFEAWPCPTLRALAAVYADHPDHRDEWRP